MSRLHGSAIWLPNLKAAVLGYSVLPTAGRQIVGWRLWIWPRSPALRSPFRPIVGAFAEGEEGVLEQPLEMNPLSTVEDSTKVLGSPGNSLILAQPVG